MVIDRWDPAESGDDWRVLAGVPYRCITWHNEDEGTTNWEEVGSDNWVTRHIEADTNYRYTAAASLARSPQHPRHRWPRRRPPQTAT